MVKNLFKKLIPSIVLECRSLLLRTRPICERKCAVCGHYGFFNNIGSPPRIDALCPKCLSLERHRLFWLWFESNKEKIVSPVLHFAPERVLEKKLRGNFNVYTTADLYAPADIKLNIEDINLPNESVKTVICNHVLEHVDDIKALKEIYRILSEDGTLIVSVPIIEGWDNTFEKNLELTPKQKYLYFGQDDHVRLYGRDFRDRLNIAGFIEISEFTAEGDDVIKYGLWRGEKIFICRKQKSKIAVTETSASL